MQEQANWSLEHSHHKYKLPTRPRINDDPMWSNGGHRSGVYPDMIGKQYKKDQEWEKERGKNAKRKGQEWKKKGARMKKERGQERVLKGAKTGFERHKNGISPDSRI